MAHATVLLVDDAPHVREAVRHGLEVDPRFRVVAEADNGEQAVAAARASCPEVVLLDIAMPVMDGLTALPLIRECCPDALIVMLSAFDAHAFGDRGQLVHADGFVQKGTSLKLIRDTVSELLDERDAL